MLQAQNGCSTLAAIIIINSRVDVNDDSELIIMFP